MTKRLKEVKKVEVDFELNFLFDLYSRVIDPMSHKIDWEGFIIWCALENITNIKKYGKLIIFIRDSISDLSKNKEERKKEFLSKNTLTINRGNNDKI